MDLPILDDELFAFLNENQHVGDRRAPEYGVKGLSNSEIEMIEDQLGFVLPPDFKHLFQNVSDPDGVLFPWSGFKLSLYSKAIERVWAGIEFDILHNRVWLKRWGIKPTSIDVAREIARKDFKNWPKLLPVYGHRFLPAEPTLSNNPVFSIVQTDIIYYGVNLAEYLVQEFCRPTANSKACVARRIPVWSDFAERAEGYNLG